MKPLKTQQQTQDFDAQTSIEEINGNPVPITVFSPVNNGDAANNVPLKDMSPKVGESSMSMEEFNRMMALYHEEYNANKVVLSITVTSMEVRPGQQRVDKETKIPLVDSDGFPIYYPDRYSVSYSFEGGASSENVSESFYKQLELNGRFKIMGKMGMKRDFGQDKFSLIWQTIQKIS